MDSMLPITFVDFYQVGFFFIVVYLVVMYYVLPTMKETSKGGVRTNITTQHCVSTFKHMLSPSL